MRQGEVDWRGVRELIAVPDYLTHYYESSRGPFRTLSDLPPAEASRVQGELRRDGRLFASRRDAEYLYRRHRLERLLREMFVERGGRPERDAPFTMVLGSCSWLLSWYRDAREIRIPIAEFDPLTISFTYGDMFPAMRFRDGRPHRGRIFLVDELRPLVERYGMPQEVNPDGADGPDRYIEAQVWSNEPVGRYAEGYRG